MFKIKDVFMEGAGETATGVAPDSAPSETDAPSGSPPTASDDWRSSLPPELRDSASIQDVPDVATLVKNYENTKAMVGNSVRIPSEEAGVDDLNAFAQKLVEKSHLGLMRRPDMDNPDSLADVYKALGRPEDTSGYEAPEGVDAEAFGALAEKALELGLTTKQFQEMASAQAQQSQELIKQIENKRLDSVHQVKGEWGNAFPEKVARAAQVAQATGAPQELIEAIQGNKVNGATLRWLDNVANSLGAEGAPMANQLDPVTKHTPDEIHQRISDRLSRMTKERLSPAEHQRLVEANVKDQELLTKAS